MVIYRLQWQKVGFISWNLYALTRRNYVSLQNINNPTITTELCLFFQSVPWKKTDKLWREKTIQIPDTIDERLAC
jgi:hypothetical protein